MTYESFKQELIQMLSVHLSADTSFQVQQILKNNGLRLDGLSISTPEVNISPTIYLNYYYEQYQSGTSLDSIADKILACYHRYRMEESIDLSFFENFKTVRERIIYKLVNLKQNEALLAEIPFVPYLDLAIVFCYHLDHPATDAKDEAITNASILIRNSHLDYWHITLTELLTAARHNTPHLLQPTFCPLTQMLAQMQLPDMEDMDLAEQLPDYPLYLLTNRRQFLGAATILYHDLLKKCADELQSDLLILPSSIHEVLLLPYDGNQSLEECSRIVCQVNEDSVSPEEILSDHVYLFDRRTNQIHY